MRPPHVTWSMLCIYSLADDIVKGTRFHHPFKKASQQGGVPYWVFQLNQQARLNPHFKVCHWKKMLQEATTNPWNSTTRLFLSMWALDHHLKPRGKTNKNPEALHYIVRNSLQGRRLPAINGVRIPISKVKTPITHVASFPCGSLRDFGAGK